MTVIVGVVGFVAQCVAEGAEEVGRADDESAENGEGACADSDFVVQVAVRFLSLNGRCQGHHQGDEKACGKKRSFHNFIFTTDAAKIVILS